MWRNIASNALSFLIVLLFVLGGVVLWGKSQYRAEGPLEQAICMEVPSGTNVRRVADNLDQQGAISSKMIFNMGVDYTGASNQLKAGSFIVPAASSMESIIDIVTRGGQSTCGTEILYRIGVNAATVEVRQMDPETARYDEVADFELGSEVPEIYTTVAGQNDTRFRIAIAEGVTSWQIMTSLNAIDTLDGDVDVIPAEGSLSPDSYEFTKGASVADILSRMEAAQATILAQAWENRADGLPFDTPEEALTLASIVEKETGIASERPLVASVFINRLEQGMRLQTDPTVIYGITKGQGTLGRGLRQSELQRETPYNTYVINGLPPTPIANPGKASIEAVLNPEQSDYIFFVAKTLNPADGHVFAATLNEHNRNVAAYRALERAAN